MRSGNTLKGQVMVDITAAWIGGYILAHKGCGGFDGGQDERLMTTMPDAWNIFRCRTWKIPMLFFFFFLRFQSLQLNKFLF